MQAHGYAARVVEPGLVLSRDLAVVTLAMVRRSTKNVVDSPQVRRGTLGLDDVPVAGLLGSYDLIVSWLRAW